MQLSKDTHEQPTTSRNTIQRALVLEAVYALCNHPTSAEVYDFVSKQYPHVSQATVYRNLDLLALRGEIVRIDVPNGAIRYDIVSKPHYHIRCKGCGLIFDVDMPYLDNLQEQICSTHGFQIEGHQIMFNGHCPDCLAKNN
ncbi:MAG: transcriptional repressor [Eggerthellaceae bacterium]|jgi:Fur family ferric uptake transcriptional regulator/Fur family peroxide stress response transcriptional regulator|nr:transcriptional repressor [Eggerthellaceae bacterium]